MSETMLPFDGDATSESEWWAAAEQQAAADRIAANIASTHHQAIAAALQSAARDYAGDPNGNPAVDPFYLAAREYVRAVDEARGQP